MSETDRPYADPAHPGNRLRPRVRCVGCGKLGCVTSWGPWCFSCNVKRLDRITSILNDICRKAGIEVDQPGDLFPKDPA